LVFCAIGSLLGRVMIMACIALHDMFGFCISALLGFPFSVFFLPVQRYPCILLLVVLLVD
jgi:hypothetical protein